MPDDTKTDSAMRFATSAHVEIRAANASTSELDTIKGLMSDPSVLDERNEAGDLKHRLFIWTAEISNDNIDTYFTRMHDTTLTNFANDATNGVMFLDSHISRKLGFGQSFAGTFKKRRGENPSRVLVDFYTLTGLNLNGVSTDDFVDGVRSSILRDVSVGFLPGRFECNICGGDPMDWWFGECPHVPGVTYNADGSPLDGDKQLSWWDLTSADAQLQRALRDYSLRATMDGPLVRAKKKSEEPVLCYAWVIDARLGEVSTVFDGATPGAAIQKAQFLATEGKADERSVRMMEMQLRVNLPRPTKIYTVGGARGGQTTIRSISVPPGTNHDDIVAAVRDAMGVNDASGDETVADRASDDEQPVEQTEAEQQPEVDANVDDGDEQADVEQDAAGAADADDAPSTDDLPAEPAENGDQEDQATGAAPSGGTSPHAAPEDLRMSGQGTDFQAALRALLVENHIEIAEDADPVAVIRATLPDLSRRAALGDKYKADLIKEALDAARAAYGKDFDAERSTKQQRMLERMDIDEIVEQRDLYRRANQFQGGRSSRERVTADDEPEDDERRTVRSATDDDDDLEESMAAFSRVVPMRAAN